MSVALRVFFFLILWYMFPSLPSPTLKYSVPINRAESVVKTSFCSLLIIYATYSAACYSNPLIYLVPKGGSAKGKRNKRLEFSFHDKSLLYDICDCPIVY